DEFEWAGSIKASDLEMALVLARETHFRHKEGVAYAVRGRGEQDLHVAAYGGEELGGVTDRSYRRQEAYAGVGRKHREVSRLLAGRGLVIDRPRPSDRKSTRLNSSHLVISYAVFCLKKKIAAWTDVSNTMQFI